MTKQEDKKREGAIIQMHVPSEGLTIALYKDGCHRSSELGEDVSIPQTRNLWRGSDYDSYDEFMAANFTIIKKES